MKLLRELSKKRNNGSSLTTVIIVCAFVSILATISLYIAGMNSKMKAADYSTKKSFYSAEEVVELFETVLIQDVSNAATDAYKVSGCRYVELQGSANRQGFYYDNFKTSFQDSWNAHWTSSDASLTTKQLIEKGVKELFPKASYYNESTEVIVSSGATNVAYDEATGVCTFDITLNGQDLYCTINAGASETQLDKLLEKGRFAYNKALDLSKCELADDGVTISSYQVVRLDLTVTTGSKTDTNGYTSRIVTSFKIVPPTVNWSDTDQLLNASTHKAITDVDFAKSVTYIDWSKE